MEGVPLGEKLNYGERRRPEFGPVWLDMTSKSLQSKGSSERQILTPSEYQTLWLLIRAQGNPISEQDILEFIHDDEDADIPLGNQVSVFLAHLRKKLHKQTDGAVTIDNMRGLGTYALTWSSPD